MLVRLTPKQRQELRAQRDKGPQPTYGKHRARTQNILCERGLSQFRADDGRPLKPYYASEGEVPLTCEITDAGRDALGR